MSMSEKYLNTVLKKHGSLENWKKSQAIIGSIGGKAKVPKGFAIRRDLAVQGGKNSKRGAPKGDKI